MAEDKSISEEVAEINRLLGSISGCVKAVPTPTGTLVQRRTVPSTKPIIAIPLWSEPWITALFNHDGVHIGNILTSKFHEQYEAIAEIVNPLTETKES